MNNLKSRRAFIVGLSSTKITNKERLFLRKYKPWGVILFARNIKSVDQTKKLTNDIKKIFKDSKSCSHVDITKSDGNSSLLLDEIEKVIKTI